MQSHLGEKCYKYYNKDYQCNEDQYIHRKGIVDQRVMQGYYAT